MHQLVLVVLWSPEVIIKFKCNSAQATILKLMQSNLTFTLKTIVTLFSSNKGFKKLCYAALALEFQNQNCCLKIAKRKRHYHSMTEGELML